MVFEIHKSIGDRYAIILTTKCNNHCIYCHSSTNYEDFFNYAFVKKKVLAEIPKSAVEIQLTGGEPTIVPYFLDFLSFLKQNYPKVKIKLQSNIRMFSVEAFLVRAKDYVDQIQTTFHSNKMEIFDAITRVKGSFNQVIKALNLIKKHKVDIYFNILILKQNYNHLRDTVLFLRKIFPSKLILLDYPFYLNEAVRNKSLIHVSFKQAKPFIEDACVDGYVRIYNIPPCVFDEKILSNVAQQGFIHDDRYIYPLKECHDCTLKKFCIGYYKQNLTLFKNYDDFKPRK